MDSPDDRYREESGYTVLAPIESIQLTRVFNQTMKETMMLNRRQALKTAVAGAAVLLTGTARSQATVNLRLAHDSPVSTPWHTGIVKMTELLRQRSNGRINIRVYPSAQLGDTREIAELTKTGTIDMALLTAGVAASFVPSMNLFGLPFLFSNSEQARALYVGDAGRRLMQDVDAAGFKGLGFNVLVFRGPMNSKRPLSTPADMAGLKIRLQQVPIHLDTYRALGASPVALPYSEVYSAAQSGVIEGAEGAASGLFGPKFHEVMGFYSTLPVFINTCLLVISQKAWNALSPEQRQLLEKVAAEGNEIIHQEFFAVDKTAVERMEAHGTKINKGPFDLKPWRAAVESVYAKYVPGLPKSGQDIVADLRKAWG